MPKKSYRKIFCYISPLTTPVHRSMKEWKYADTFSSFLQSINFAKTVINRLYISYHIVLKQFIIHISRHCVQCSIYCCAILRTVWHGKSNICCLLAEAFADDTLNHLFKKCFDKFFDIFVVFNLFSHLFDFSVSCWWFWFALSVVQNHRTNSLLLLALLPCLFECFCCCCLFCGSKFQTPLLRIQILLYESFIYFIFLELNQD